jgi:hypothetical protein
MKNGIELLATAERACPELSTYWRLEEMLISIRVDIQ